MREALAPAPVCAQFPSPFAGVESADLSRPLGQEDCLYLHVYAPRFTNGEVPRDQARLPVLLWIHGGGNVIGHANFYDGGNLAATERVIVVALNYRLGPLGWFRHAALRTAGSDRQDPGGRGGWRAATHRYSRPRVRGRSDRILALADV